MMSQNTKPLEKGKFSFSDIPDQTGKVIVVTGANRGLGFIATRELAKQNASVILACRNVSEAEKIKLKILSINSTAKLDVLELNLASLQSINKFAITFKEKYDKLDVLLNNAGATPRAKVPANEKTTDGFEYYFGVNHLGTFALTCLLFNLLLKSPGSRIVTVSSLSHIQGRINFDDLGKKRSIMQLYGQSKLANLLFSYELSRKILHQNLDMRSIAVHPGFSLTSLYNPNIFSKLGRKLFAQSAEKGSLPLLYACVMPDALNGDYIGPKGFLGLKGAPKRVKSSKRSYNEVDATNLWNITEDLVHLHLSL